MSYAGNFQRHSIQINDNRLRLIREVFQGIKYIKLSGAEERYKADIQNVRRSQEAKQAGWMWCMNLFIDVNQAVPLLMPVATFVLYGM
jgi:hypothetical protein